jgi:hypothetical protein
MMLGSMPENESLQFGEWEGGGRGGLQTFPQSADMEYGELPEPIALYPPAPNDQHSYAGMSDITSDPGY